MISTDVIQTRLLRLAAIFMFFYCACLTLAPAARARTWEAGLRWEHWLIFLGWAGMYWFANRQSARRLPERDPYLLPITALLSGWGWLTIWRLSPYFGIRQSLWMVIALAGLTFGMRLPNDLSFLRRYKYLWLTGGLLLTASTLIFGTNPSGSGLPRLWLGCCGIYLQPSEPLKLLLIVYLTAYLADRLPAAQNSLEDSKHLKKWNQLVVKISTLRNFIPLLGPTLIMTGLALLLLVFQRDLGTALIFLYLYAVIVYIASGRKSTLAAMTLAILLAGVTGYALFDVVRLRIDAWLNPWADPSGRSFQIVQSLLAIANGGLFGRGPGMGSPGLVPVSHSDFIYSSIAEESGLVGSIGLFILLAMLVNRGFRIALQSAEPFRRYLAVGLTAHLVGQSLLIIGGNLRLLPLTGVTLPFISYGGSSLLISFFSLLLLLHLSRQSETRPVVLPRLQPYMWSHRALLGGLTAAALAAGWWAAVRGPDLLARTDNPRRALADRYVHRGSLLDRHNQPLAETQGQPGTLQRRIMHPDLSPVIGYTHPVYGQSGLEASLDPYLRGIQGNPGLLIWWDHLLYGQPPPGLDVRLTLDNSLQRLADNLLGDHSGAAVLLNASNGDILVMASHPTFDANQLEQIWPTLIQEANTPLINRATQGQYQPGPSLGMFLLAELLLKGGGAPPLPQQLSYPLGTIALDCAVSLEQYDWPSMMSAGCPWPVTVLGESLEKRGVSLTSLFQGLGLYSIPGVRLPASITTLPEELPDARTYAVGQADLRVSPLQMVLAAACLSNDGIRPAPRLEMAINTPHAGWVILPDGEEPVRVFPEGLVSQILETQTVDGLPIWQSLAIALNGPDQMVSWYLGGSLPDWGGTQLTVVVLLEEKNAETARQIGQAILGAALHLR